MAFSEQNGLCVCIRLCGVFLFIQNFKILNDTVGYQLFGLCAIGLELEAAFPCLQCHTGHDTVSLLAGADGNPHGRIQWNIGTEQTVENALFVRAENTDHTCMNRVSENVAVILFCQDIECNTREGIRVNFQFVMHGAGTIVLCVIHDAL